MDIVTITITAGTLITIIIYAMSDLRLLQWRGSVKWPVDKPQHFHLLCPTSCPVTLPPTNYPVHPTRYNWKVQRTAAQTTHSLSQKPLPLSTTQSTQYNEEEPVWKTLSHRIPATTPITSHQEHPTRYTWIEWYVTSIWKKFPVRQCSAKSVQYCLVHILFLQEPSTKALHQKTQCASALRC